MKRPSPLLLLLTVCCAAVLPACAQAPIPHAVRIGSIEELQAYFTYDPGRDIIVSGHRGGMMPGYPENCIESCEKTLSMMPTFFEVDFSFTRDSVMVLMHDLTIDRTTTGKGRVADYTYAELQQFCLVDRDRNVTPYKIPRLKDLLEWGKDKVVFNFDNKYINTRGVSDEVRRASLDYYIKQLQPGGDWSMYHNIMLSVRSVEEALYYWEHGIRNVMFCVEISSMEHFRAYDASPIPWKYIMAYIRLAVNPDLQPVYDLLHAEGIADKRRDHHDLHVGRDHHQEKRSKAQQSHAHNEIQRIDARHAYSPTLPRLTTCTPSVPFRSTRRPLPTDFPLAYSVTGASASPPNAKV